MCGKPMQVDVPTKYSYKTITVKCGSTSPDGSPWLCEKCEKIHGHRNWRQEAMEAGENFDDDY